MNPSPIHQQRLEALKLAVKKKQRFSSMEELRKIKYMTIITHLIEFGCATSRNLLLLLEQQNNAVLTQLVNARMIKIMRWQNHQVYVPTQRGKDWLLASLNDDDEIKRVRETPIRRKINGFSSEHDLLLQTVAINYAVDYCQPGESWRIFKPKKTKLEGKVPDALILFSREGFVRRVAVELERTRKDTVRLIASVVRTAEVMAAEIDEKTPEGFDYCIVIATSMSIARDYEAALFAMSDLEDGGLKMMAPTYEMLQGPIPRPGLALAYDRGYWFQAALAKFDVLMCDAEGELISAGDARESVLFSDVFWQIAMRQPQVQDWRSVVKRAVSGIAYNLAEEKRDPTSEARDDIFGQKVPEPEIDPAAVEHIARSLIEAFEGSDNDNPMAGASHLARARSRWSAMQTQIWL